MNFISEKNIEISNREYQNDVIAPMKAAYLAYNEASQTKTMRELLTPIIGELTIGKSTKGYAQVTIGASLPGPVIYCDSDSVINAINAIADLPKYRILEHWLQVAHFDPSTNRKAIKVMRDAAGQCYRFWNWTDGGFGDCFMNYEIRHSNGWVPGTPDPRYQKLVNWRNNTINKHAVIDKILECKNVQPFAVVMFDEAQLAHYQVMIVDNLDKPYSAYRQARADADELAGLLADVRTGGTQFASTKVLTPERSALLLDISVKDLPFTILVKEPFLKEGKPRLIDTETARSSAVSGLRDAADDVVITIK